MQTTEGKAKYFAFISHKSADSRFALRLQKFIENYNLPTEIRKTTKSPKRLTPICSYEMDFSSKPLYDEMTDKLKSSQYLILICSEELIKSGTKYVNYEIETFFRLKREAGLDPAKYVIPIITSGKFGDEEHECCPEALKVLGENCPIAIDRSGYKNDREVFLHAVSGMLDIDYAVLENRDRKRRRRERTAVIAASLLSLALAVGAFDYFVPKNRHYRDFVFQNGIPVGIGELARKEYRTQSSHYIITEQQRKTTELRYVNSEGNTKNHENDWLHGDRAARYVFSYTKSGLSSATLYDSAGVPIYIMQYSDIYTADLKDPYVPGLPYYMNADFVDKIADTFDSNLGHSGVSRFSYEYDKNGYVKKITYHTDSSGRPAEVDGVFGIEYENDLKGRVTRQFYLDADGKRRENSDGVYFKEYKYDSNDCLLYLKNYTRNGSLTADAYGICHLAKTYDENGNAVSLELFDSKGNRALNPLFGGAKQVYTSDSRGRTTLVVYEAEDPAQPNPLGVDAIRYTYDENGYLGSIAFLDKELNAVEHPSTGTAYEYYVNDSSGRMIELYYCGENGELVCCADNFAKAEYSYNENGSLTSARYTDALGNGANYCGYGYSQKILTYDSYGRQIGTEYLNAAGEPAEIQGHPEKNGYSKLVFEYESTAALNKITVSYYGADGKLTDITDSATDAVYAKTVVVYQGGEVTSLLSYFADGKRGGACIETSNSYTAQGKRITATTRTDADGRLLLSAITRYDERGVLEQTEQSVYYDSGSLMATVTTSYGSGGAKESELHLSYTEDGALDSEKTQEFDTDGDLLKSVMRFCEDTLTVSETEYFGDGSYTKILKSYNGANEASGISLKVISAYSADGKTLSKYYYMYGETLTTKYTEYYEDGTSAVLHTVFSSMTESEKDVLETLLIKYDADGTAVYEYMTIALEDSMQRRYYKLYNADGSYSLTERLVDANGNVVSSGTQYYDSNDNRIN